MRVEQNQTGIIEFLQQGTAAQETATSVFSKEKAAAESTQQGSAVTVNMKDVTYMKPQAEEEKSLEEQLEQGAAMNAQDRKNQMTVLSNTTSEEDYEKIQEDGFSLDQSAGSTIITVTDKIKTALAKAGVDISSFGDDLDLSEMEAITGSAELAAQLAAALKQADLPLTKENQQDAAEALMQALSLTTPTEGAVKYMMDNHLEPTIQNLYLAQNSGGTGYFGPQSQFDISSFKEQVESVIREAGIAVDEASLADSRWLLEHEIPLTPENLQYLQDLKGVGTAVCDVAESTMSEQSWEAVRTIASSIAEAVAEGARPADAVLLEGYKNSGKAQTAFEAVNQATDEDLAYLVDHDLDLTIQNLKIAAANRGEHGAASEDGQGGQNKASDYTQKGLALLTAKRQLEEARLAMTAEANYALLKKGISIDTKPLAELVDQLKEEENSYYRNLLAAEGVTPNEENVALLKETIEKISDIRDVPAYVLGQKSLEIPTVDSVHSTGMALKDTFERANERYETLMTAPRADLGDSIKKAFRNVDDLLNDLNLDTSEANRRAVRILAYNELEITEDAISRMKEADEKVQRVFANLTPSVVTKMVKDGINPLSMDFDSLNRTAEQIRLSSGEEEAEKFSEYLWKLEQNQKISEQERASYIGIYRLIHQVESSDGAAIGALVHQGAEFTMKNLLTAVRSEKKSGKVDISVDDTAGSIESAGYKGASITEQIEAAYQMNCIKDVTEVLSPESMRDVLQKTKDWQEMTPEQLKEALLHAPQDESADASYCREQLDMLKQCAAASKDVYEALEKYDIPNTVNNILALEAMRADGNKMFRKIFGSGLKDSDDKVGVEDIEKIKEELIKEFGEAVSEPEEMAIAQEKLGELAENVMKGMITDGEVTSIDVREMRLLSAQLSVNSLLAKQEKYSVPVMVNGGVVNVSLKIVRGVDKKGIVDIMMESELRGKIAATFQAKEDGISGFLATDNPGTKALFEENASQLTESIFGQGGENTDMHYAYVKDLDFDHFSTGRFGEKAKEQESGDESYRVQTTRLYHIAESFIRQIRSIV